MGTRTDDEILEDLKDWPVRNIYVERGVKLIEQLRQRVAELESLIDLDVFSLVESNVLLRRRVAELESQLAKNNPLLDEAADALDKLTTERDALKKLYESSEESVLALKETRNRLAEERDKATQYWQIAEGRCDALMKQIAELVAAISIAEPVMDAHAGPSRIADFRAALASVKEK